MQKKYTPLSVHPDNPHYFLFREKPEILITSCEHYGAVLNLGVDHDIYLDELKNCGMNATRLFTGYYHEIPGAFGIEGNTLAPEVGMYLCPWERTDVPGARGGGNKFDLDRFDEKYMKRLYSFLQKASERNIVVELSLFCPFYEHVENGIQWEIAPLFYDNNINDVEKVSITEVHNLRYPRLLFYQEKMVKKIVTLLNCFDNLYYEICNEPYNDGITKEWQRHIAKLIVEAEKELDNKHLIGQNIANGFELIEDPDENVSVFSFHYTGSVCMIANYGLGKPVGCNETGFNGSAPDFYRQQAWELFMSGAGTYFGLDYSFTSTVSDGSFEGKNQPGTGSREFRLQLKALKEFLYNAGFINMKPNYSFIKQCDYANGNFYAMAELGKTYAVYGNCNMSSLVLNIPYGIYNVTWLNPVSCAQSQSKINHNTGKYLVLTQPDELYKNSKDNHIGEFAVSISLL